MKNDYIIIDKKNINEIEKKIDIPNENIENDIFKINNFKKNINNDLNNIEFIYNKCKKCSNYTQKNIYKCIFCDNYYLCDECYKISDKNKYHKHEDFFEIKYPNIIIDNIKELQNIGFHKIINSFNFLLNNIFLDKNGNITTKPLNNDDINNLKNICKEMDSINVNPLIYFNDYEKAYINEKLQKMEEDLKSLIITKIAIFLDKLTEIVK